MRDDTRAPVQPPCCPEKELDGHEKGLRALRCVGVDSKVADLTARAVGVYIGNGRCSCAKQTSSRYTALVRASAASLEKYCRIEVFESSD